MSCFIRNSVQIRPGRLSLNGSPVFSATKSGGKEFKEFYDFLKIDYPKFHKMDKLSKLAFVAAELVLQDIDIQKIAEEKRAILLSNKSSSLDIDLKHQASIQDSEMYFPSPANFVYTLPNICIGEVAIKHKFKGENNFYISDGLDTTLFEKQISYLFDKEKADLCLAGQVEIVGDIYQAEVFLVLRDGEIEFNKSNFESLWKN